MNLNFELTQNSGGKTQQIAYGTKYLGKFFT